MDPSACCRFISANSAAIHLADYIDAQSVTKIDLAEVHAELRQDIAEVRAELRQDLAGLRTELKQDSAGLRAELGTEIGGVRTGMAGLHGEQKLLRWMLGTPRCVASSVLVLAAQSGALRWQLFALNAKMADLGERVAVQGDRLTRIEQAVKGGVP
jgi:hypothetical protein